MAEGLLAKSGGIETMIAPAIGYDHAGMDCAGDLGGRTP